MLSYNCLLLFKVYFVRIKNSVFSGLSRNRCTNDLFALRSSFLSVFIFCFVVLSSSKRQIYVLGDVRRITGEGNHRRYSIISYESRINSLVSLNEIIFGKT